MNVELSIDCGTKQWLTGGGESEHELPVGEVGELVAGRRRHRGRARAQPRAVSRRWRLQQPKRYLLCTLHPIQ